MGLAEELKTSQEHKGNVPTIDPDSINQLNLGLEQATVEETPSEPVVEKSEKAAEVFRIGTQEFSSLDEAMKYAQKLELEKAERNAYELGKQEAEIKDEPVVPKVSFEEEIQDLLFDNPAEALRRYKEHITQEIKSSIATESKVERERAAAWNEFYETNPDLLENSQLVEYVLEKNWNTLGGLEAKQGLKELAVMTKALLQQAAKSQLPKDVLEDRPAAVTQTSGEKAPTPVVMEDLVDFATQIRRLNKRQLKKS